MRCHWWVEQMYSCMHLNRVHKKNQAMECHAHVHTLFQTIEQSWYLCMNRPIFSIWGVVCERAVFDKLLRIKARLHEPSAPKFTHPPTWCSFSILLLPMTVLQPWRMSSSAILKPIPEAPPVTKATFPRSRSSWN